MNVMWFLFSADGAASMGIIAPSDRTPNVYTVHIKPLLNELKVLERERYLCEETVNCSPAWDCVGRVPLCKDYT